MVSINYPEVEDVEPSDAHLAEKEVLDQVPEHRDNLQERHTSSQRVLLGLVCFKVHLNESNENMRDLELNHYLLELRRSHEANVEVHLV